VANIPLIIAHRGASALAPENTLVSFRRALKDGAEGLECDVRLASDNVPVVFHDSTLKRTAFQETKLCNLTSRELAKVDVGTWFNFRHEKYARNEYCRERVPTLEQFFELMRGNDKLIYVELKCEDENYAKFARAITELTHDFDYLHRVVVKSFEHVCLSEMRRISSQIRIAALYKPNPSRVLRPGRELVKPALRVNADEISLHYTLATARAVSKAHAAGLRTVIWTADHPAWVKRAAKLGIYAIITNNPARLLAKRDELLVNERF
jgi:glycerophosphoryl diester phosphodiesterase